MIYYEPIKVMIHILSLVKVIIDMVMYYHNIFKLIIIDQDLLFKSKF